jgi:glycosyltransferase involved in cell wall biosynthesis
MANLVIFSRYYGTNSGGAERSTYAFIKSIESNYDLVYVVVFGGGGSDEQFLIDSSWEKININVVFNLKRFRYLEYFLNLPILIYQLRKLNTQAKILKSDWYTYGFYAPLTKLLHISGKVFLSIRDETGIGLNVNYHQGFSRFIKEAFRVLESPFYVYWKFQLLKIFCRADKIYANSSFIKQKVLTNDVAGNKVEVIYPEINIKELQNGFVKTRSQKIRFGIIGNNTRKGTDIFINLAKYYPECLFYIFDRSVRDEKNVNNVVYKKWENNIKNVYSQIDILLIPSRWMEAYGRVVLEALALNISVIAHNIGGIPEACKHGEVYSKDYKLVSDLSLHNWRKAIDNKLTDFLH